MTPEQQVRHLRQAQVLADRAVAQGHHRFAAMLAHIGNLVYGLGESGLRAITGAHRVFWRC